MTQDVASPPSGRPYFIPGNIDFSALPEAVQLVFNEVVKPAYDGLVLGASTPLERSAGISLVFLLSLEVVDQFQLGHGLNLMAAPSMGDTTERDKQIARHLRLISAKQQAASFLLRLDLLRARDGLPRVPAAQF